MGLTKTDIGGQFVRAYGKTTCVHVGGERVENVRVGDLVLRQKVLFSDVAVGTLSRADRP